MGKWLGHRDLCELQWSLPCSCRCEDVACPGLDACTDPDCPPNWPQKDLEEGN